jgi:hypothetical protein
MRISGLREVLTAAPFFISLTLFAQASDPYASITPEQKAVLQPGIERYIKDQLHEKWDDLYQIQDQTSDLKNELLLGERDAPDMTRDQYVKAMKYTLATGGFPRLKGFSLSMVRADKGNFIVIGCGQATRESWHGTGTVIFGARIVDGQAKFDIWGMTGPCSDTP